MSHSGGSIITTCETNGVDDIEDFGQEDKTKTEDWDLESISVGIRPRRTTNVVKIHLRNHNHRVNVKDNKTDVTDSEIAVAIDDNDRNNKENSPVTTEFSKTEIVSANIKPTQNIVLQNDLVAENYKVYVKTWGCSHNSSDSEYMAGLLQAYGFQMTNIKDTADVWILNSCTVKGPAEQHFKNEIESGQKMGKSIIVSGCVPQSAPKNSYIKGLSIIGVQQIDQVVQVVEETLMGNTVRLLSQRKEVRLDENGDVGKKMKAGGARLNLPKIRRNALIEIIPISTGCLNSCTYCKTKFARGDLGSYSIDEIVGRAKHVFAHEGVKEIWLTSEDLGAWGIDLGLNIADLLNELVTAIPDDCMLRIGMTNPPYILDHLEEISKILSHPKVYSFLHIPVQSGSDNVLSDMKREYCIKDFERVVEYLREKVPGVSIATDIICGFPTETEEDFKDTLKLVEKFKFPSLFINQFYPRPGTRAAKMQRIPTQHVKVRTKQLTTLFQSYTPYEAETRVGKTYHILITEVSHDGKLLVGHNKFYEQILVEPPDPLAIGNSELMGKWVTVKIKSTSKHSMIGVRVNTSFSFDFKALAAIILLFLTTAAIITRAL